MMLLGELCTLNYGRTCDYKCRTDLGAHKHPTTPKSGTTSNGSWLLASQSRDVCGLASPYSAFAAAIAQPKT